jgi:hypothetical protein
MGLSGQLHTPTDTHPGRPDTKFKGLHAERHKEAETKCWSCMKELVVNVRWQLPGNIPRV